jgi:hypothetical protein
MPPTITNWLFGLGGGIVGGAIGYLAFFWLAGLGLYALVVPGALIGLGCGAFSGFKSNRLGIACALFALLLGCYSEWRIAPFVRDGSFGYFLAHAHTLRTRTLMMIVIGGIFAFWFGRGRQGGVWLRHSRSESDS